MSSAQFKIFYGDNFERCRMHRMKKERFELITYQEFACEVLKTIGAFLEGKTPRDVCIQYTEMTKTHLLTWAATKILSTLTGVYGQWTTARTCTDYQLECMILRLQFRLYMLEMKARSWTSRQSDDVFHRRRENSCTKFARNWDTRRLWLSTAFRFSCKKTCRGDLYFVVSAVVLCSLKSSCFRGVGETHRRFAGSTSLGVLPSKNVPMVFTTSQANSWWVISSNLSFFIRCILHLSSCLRKRS